MLWVYGGCTYKIHGHGKLYLLKQNIQSVLYVIVYMTTFKKNTPKHHDEINITLSDVGWISLPTHSVNSYLNITTFLLDNGYKTNNLIFF